MLGSTQSKFLLALGLALVVDACGGGGGGGGGSSPPPCAASIKTCYVTVDGYDGNDGSAPDPAHAFGTIGRAVEVVQDNYTVDVGPGTYHEAVSTDRQNRPSPSGLRLIAQNGPAVIDAAGTTLGAGIRVSNSDNSVINGFTVINSPGAGILVKSGSDNFSIRNCIVHDSTGDGINIQDSSGVLLFNNLVYGNGGLGIGVVGSSGSPNATLFNNTIAFNVGRGITVGTSSGASTGALLRNNIVQQNGSGTPPSINVRVLNDSISGFDGDFDLVFPANSYSPANLAGRNDVNENALFSGATANGPPEDFQLQIDSPAIDMGATLTGGHPLLKQCLQQRTTTGVNLDSGVLDIGYHFPANNPAPSCFVDPV